MLRFLRFAAIDIGSNAVRLLLSGVFESDAQPVFKKITLVRMPVRLGRDVFSTGQISEAKARQLIASLKGFGQLMKAYSPLDVMACATSAMRVAENGPRLCRQIQRETGISVAIISGKQEAEILFQNKSDIEALLSQEDPSMFVDVGGGSTEITLYSRGRVMASESFNIGTVRLLEDLVSESDWHQLKDWLQSNAAVYPKISTIGSGGNINKSFRMVQGKPGKPITRKKLNQLAKYLSGFSNEQRVTQLGMRPDRADVILPALNIYRQVMKWAKTETIFVPILGLADGMIHLLYQAYRTDTDSA